MRAFTTLIGLLLLGVAGTAQAAAMEFAVQSVDASGNVTFDLIMNLTPADSVIGYQVSVDLGGSTFLSGTCASPAAFVVNCPFKQPVNAPYGNRGFAGDWAGFTPSGVSGPQSLNLGTLRISYSPGATLLLGVVTPQDAVVGPGGAKVSVTNAVWSRMPEP